MKWLLISPHYPPKKSGVGDYTQFLKKSLEEHSLEVDVLHDGNFLKSWKSLDVLSLNDMLDWSTYDEVIIQYTPNMYNPKGGINLLFPFVVSSIARRHKNVSIYFHEVAFPYRKTLKSFILNFFHRIQAHLLIKNAKRVFTSSDIFVNLLTDSYKTEAKKISVGSNIPISRINPLEIKSEFLINENDNYIVLFGGFHESKKYEQFYELIDSIDLKIIHIGMTKDRLPEQVKSLKLDGYIFTDYLSDREVSGVLQCGYPLYCYFDDGASTRRGSLIAGLNHGCRVITNFSSFTDSIFKGFESIKKIKTQDDVLEVFNNDEKYFKSEPVVRINQSPFEWQIIARDYIDLLK